MSQSESNLSRNLHNRHIQLIALGGTIGVGLFLGSAQAIHNAGPGLLLTYVVGGTAILFIMRALGELLTYRPVAGSFATYADEFCGPFAGFITGWSYWFNWVVSVMAETTAIGIYVRYWIPWMPQWLPPLIVLIVLYGANLVAVRMFGELEFWFALIKVVAIMALILAGLGVIFFHFGDFGSQASFTNLWTHGGFLPFGTLGVLLTLQIVMFAYSGVELIGVTAGEAENPAVVLPRATNGIIFRILLFYLGALIVIMALVPWNQLSPDTSPFVFVFQKLGIPAAASIINAVVITAAASSCNSGIFSTGRMLYSLACRGQSPRVFASVNRQNVPAAAIHASAAIMLVGVFLNYEVPKHVFTWVTSIVLIGTLLPWGMIMAAHLGYRRAVREGRAAGSTFRMPGAPVVNYLVIAFLLFVTAMLWLQPDTRVALYVAPFWFGLLAVGYFLGVKPQAVRAAS
ncbi:MAG TPA: amino acid permease [Steroidobacteraceae bacterium]|nr:amino acid permease [Steroidobacteraceae bacterium]